MLNKNDWGSGLLIYVSTYNILIIYLKVIHSKIFTRTTFDKKKYINISLLILHKMIERKC